MLFFVSTISSVVYLRCRMQIQAKPMNRKRFWNCLLSNGGRNSSKRFTAWPFLILNEVWLPLHPSTEEMIDDVEWILQRLWKLKIDSLKSHSAATSWLLAKKSVTLQVEILLFWVMNRLFATYGNNFISYANASESLLAMLTPPYKHSYNQIVSRSNTVLSHILALPLGILCPVRNAFFVCKFLNNK